jgi:hypothetical protein
MESDMDTDYLEMFTNELFTDGDVFSNNDTVTLAEESHSLNTPPLVDLADDEQQHSVVDLSGDPEPDVQEVVQEPTAPSTSPAPPLPPPATS